MVFVNRLINAIDKFNLLSKNQIGFIKGYRTADHTFIINSIVDQFVKTMKQDICLFRRFEEGLRYNQSKSFDKKLYDKGIFGKF